MASWHARRLGPGLRKRRKRAGISLNGLAKCMLAEGFWANEIADSVTGQPDESTLEKLLEVIEEGGEWPFDDVVDSAVDERFVDAAAACLHTQGQRPDEQTIQKRMARDLAEDVSDSYLHPEPY